MDLPGTNLLQTLSKPNGMTLTQTYEAQRDLLIGMAYRRGSSLVVQREYSYDELGRPTARNTARQGSVVNDTFTHNTRSELVEALVNGKDYEYTFDNIGNRQFAMEDNNAKVYDTNALNQYSAISENGAAAFVPQFDADGNQTLIITETGVWSAVYNAENRPVTFTNSESNTVVECQYDAMGRRVFKKVISGNGTVTSHQRFIYRGYLQIACVDLTRTNHPCLWLITWDPTQPIATRPLAIQKDGTWYTYGLDLTKNVCEVFGPAGNIRTAYTYSPYGSVTATGNVTQPIQWSSEVYDEELGLVYYNWRHYAPLTGNWISRDTMEISNLYSYILNRPIFSNDYLGEQSLSSLLKTRMLYLYNNHSTECGTNYENPPEGFTLTDCIIYCTTVIEWAYNQLGQKDIAKKISTMTDDGIELAKYLNSIGWVSIYWNPDARNPRDDDSEHPDSYKNHVLKNSVYDNGLAISHSVINYNPTQLSEEKKNRQTKKDSTGLDKLNKVEFGFGNARGGKHTFLFSKGDVYEVHWEGIGTSVNGPDGLYEKSPFVDYGWLSGSLTLPPDNGQFA